MRRAPILVCAAAALLGAAAPAGAHQRSDAVSVWNANAGKAAVAACISPAPNPLNESRLYAMSSVAVHDALNAIHRRSEPYVFDGRAQPGASVDAAVAAAAHGTLVPVLKQQTAPFTGCIDAAVASVEADYTTALAAIPEGRAKEGGLAIGEAAAAAIVAARAGDGADATPLRAPDYVQGTEPGEWRFTPGSPFAFGTGWGAVKPFVLRDASEFRPGPPYAITSPEYTRDFDEVKALGSATSSARTPEQTQIAEFWVESSPLAWNRIARTLAAQRGLGAWQQARLFGLVDLAMADGYISAFATKYHYRFWRPVTAIQTADTDGNPDTAGDPSWTPLRPTPAMPDYDSAHSIAGGAASTVMARVLGTDRISFAACSRTLPAGSNCADATPVYRHYASLSQAADENGLSRILVGFHFRKAVEEGIAHGRKIGDRAVDRFMRRDD